MDKENNGADVHTPVSRRQTLACGSASSLRGQTATPSSAQRKTNNVSMDKLRDDNKVLRTKLNEEGRLR
jgi:hypothetical protein